MKKLLLAWGAFVLFAPMLALLAVAALVSPATANCVTPSGPIAPSTVPDQLQVTTASGASFTLNQRQLTRAASIISIGASIEGVDRDAITIALMAALTESNLRQLSNTAAYPESGGYPNDGDASDHDSLGLFQMRPSTGWGTVEELMDVDYQVRGFFGGPQGPNHPSPRGLLEIPGWQHLDKGAAAQAIEVSAYPDRYRAYQPVAETILTALTDENGETQIGGGSTRIVFPLPDSDTTVTSRFGMRTHPITGVRKLHTGVDFSATDGTPILAAADGIVSAAGPAPGYGNLILIEHEINGQVVATGYAHMWDHGIHVRVGDQVTAGQHIADVGSSGYSTGPHLHFEYRPGGTRSAPTDPEPWLASNSATVLAEATAPVTGQGCQPETALFAPETGITPPTKGTNGAWPAESCSLPDPTQPGRRNACVTPRTARLVQQIEAMKVGHNGIYCWDAHAWNPTSDHPQGKACDVTFGKIGRFPSETDKDNGDRLAEWLVTNADTWGVKYVIWAGRIWSTARSDEGWRPYNGGGVYNPADATGGHHDHVHISVD